MVKRYTRASQEDSEVKRLLFLGEVRDIRTRFHFIPVNRADYLTV